MNPRAARSLVIGLSAFGMLQSSEGQTTEARIDQARHVSTARSQLGVPASSDATSVAPSESFVDYDDAFGAQQILKRSAKLKPFDAFADISAFFTNNVGLTRRAAEQDGFFVATFGFGYRRPLTNSVQVEVSGRGALFRYNEFQALDFNSIDAGASILWTPTTALGVTFFARYNFTSLSGAESGNAFFTSHTVATGGQKTFVLSRAHALFTGVALQAGFADPAVAQRDEYSAYAGYHVQATSTISGNLLYRYAHLVYGEQQNRRDHSQTVSLALKYSVADWLTVTGSSFFGFNLSTQDVFEYSVVNAGAGMGLSVQF